MRVLWGLALLVILSQVAQADTITAGVDDNFGGGTDPAFPSADFAASINNVPTANFDGTPHNLSVAHTFAGLPSGIVSGTLEFRVRGGRNPGVDTDLIVLSFVDENTVTFLDAVVWVRTFGTFGGGLSIVRLLRGEFS